VAAPPVTPKRGRECLDPKFDDYTQDSSERQPKIMLKIPTELKMFSQIVKFGHDSKINVFYNFFKNLHGA
jgi:hypothetical protein